MTTERFSSSPPADRRLPVRWPVARERGTRYLLPIGALLALWGYVGPWINHPVAGLVIPGLDLGEYVKFLPATRAGTLTLWRPGLYLPLFAVSLVLSLHIFRRSLGYTWAWRVPLIGLAGVAALNMLPPAWTPALLRTPEFRVQSLAIAIALGVLLTSPLWALLPRRITGLVTTALILAALWFPLFGFFQMLDDIGHLYGHPQRPAWGMWLMLSGCLLLLTIGVSAVMQTEPNPDQAPSSVAPAQEE